jgi:hypothetical protein
VSDRQQEVLNAIDLALDGCDEDLSVSSDAMRWSPGPDNVTEERLRTALGEAADQLHPWQLQIGAAILDAHAVAASNPDTPTDWFRRAIETRGRNVMGPPGFARAIGGPVRGPSSSDAILARLSPAEAIIPGPNGPIHIRDAYGDEPMQVTEINHDHIEGDNQ